MITFCPAFVYPFVRLCLNFLPRSPGKLQLDLAHFIIIKLFAWFYKKYSENMKICTWIYVFFLRVNLHLCAKTKGACKETASEANCIKNSSALNICTSCVETKLISPVWLALQENSGCEIKCVFNGSNKKTY